MYYIYVNTCMFWGGTTTTLILGSTTLDATFCYKLVMECVNIWGFK